MTLTVLFAARDVLWARYSTALPEAFRKAGLDIRLIRACGPVCAPDQVDYIVYAPNPDLTDFSPYTNARAVLCLWAGVEDITPNKTLTQPLARMVDTGLAEGMVEWVTGHVLRHHLGIDAHIVNPDHLWHPVAPPLARNRTVGILGLGELGSACATALAGLNFNVIGWSRNPKTQPGIICRSGPDGLNATLALAEILVLLLPLTPATDNLLNADRLARLPKGAVILNPGRGALIEDTALLEALNSGHLAHATLDVFRTEPLPPDHAFWAHPQITVTPHIASETRAETASQVIAENIRRAEAGAPLLHLVDRGAGY